MIIKSLHCKPAVNFLFTSSTHICTPIAEGLTKSLASPERIFIHHKVSCVRNFTKCEQDSRSIYIHSMFLLIFVIRANHFQFNKMLQYYLKFLANHSHLF